MEKKYTYEIKKKIVERIGKLRRKRHLVKIYDIISSEEIKITKKKQCVLMFFHKLKNETYKSIEDYLNNVDKNEKKNYKEIFESNYKPYVEDDFPSQNGISPKLKCNKEKNLIKRKRYNNNINSNNNSEVIYVDYGMSESTLSENNSK